MRSAAMVATYEFISNCISLKSSRSASIAEVSEIFTNLMSANLAAGDVTRACSAAVITFNSMLIIISRASMMECVWFHLRAYLMALVLTVITVRCAAVVIIFCSPVSTVLCRGSQLNCPVDKVKL